MPLGIARLNTLAKAVSAPVAYIQATGGTESTVQVGGTWYKIHEFTTNGTFTVTSGGNVNAVVVGGGGGGGGNAYNDRSGSGGGGAGQVILLQDQPVTAQGYSITIGNGGGAASPGGNTIALGQTAGGGGAGGYVNSYSYAGGNSTNGSGGGGAANSFSASYSSAGGTGGQSSGGGGYRASSTQGGGGGGGALPANGAYGSVRTGGAGKDLSSIFGTTVGDGGFFGGGGGGGLGGTTASGSAGLGGDGGGGDGARWGNGLPALANTGGGGGGSGGDGNGNRSGGAGGSGVVVISYPTTAPTLTYRTDPYASYLQLAVTFDGNSSSGTTDVAHLINTNLTGTKTKTQGASSTIQTSDKYWTSPDYGGALQNDRSGSALTYDLSSNGGAAIPASASGTFVVEGWFKATNSSTNQNWCLSSADSGGRWLFGVNSGTARTWANENNVGIGTSWAHLAVVCDGGSKRFYINGIYVGAWYSTNSGFSVFNLGQFNSGDGNDFYGWIQDFRVYVGTNKGYTGTNTGSANFTLPSSIVEIFG